MKTSLPIPRGATLLKKPVKLKIAGWNDLVYDATLKRFGVNWHRVKGGFGTQGWSAQTAGQYLRDDWVANLPCVSVAVTVGDWHTASFSGRSCEFSTMTAAMKGKLEQGLRSAEHKHSSACDLLAEATSAIAVLKRAIAASQPA